MKKILFCLQTMVCGGVEKELITILKRFDRTKYELSVLLMYESDTDMQRLIPEDVRVINLNIDRDYFCSGTQRLMEKRLQKGHVCEALKIGILKVLGHIPASALVSLAGLLPQKEQYDYAVCYHVHSPIVLRYVVEKINAVKKIAWIHNDFKTTRYEIGKYDKWLCKYDLFVGVSKQLTKEFIEICPQYENTTQTVNNIVDQQEILEKASDFSEVESFFIEDKQFKIVTVGRFVEQKGFDIAISACEYLKKQGVPIVWYVIGYGKDAELLSRLVCEKGLEKEYIILGRKENPYPYIHMADLYVQPSRHEGYAVTIEEAKVLRKIVVCTNFAGAVEQIENGVNGVVVSEFTAKAIGEAILHLYRDKNYRQQLYDYIQNKEQINEWEKVEDVFQI